jgi:CreA protein
MHKIMTATLVALVGSLMAATAQARDIGSVSTTIRLLGAANDKIKIEAFADPKIEGITCYISRAVTGGIAGAVGLAEDTSDAAIECAQTGPIVFKEAILTRTKGEEVFNERRSILFKSLQVTRFFDPEANTVIYLTWSDRLIEGSPKNSISAVVLQPWGTAEPGKPLLK